MHKEKGHYQMGLCTALDMHTYSFPFLALYINTVVCSVDLMFFDLAVFKYRLYYLQEYQLLSGYRPEHKSSRKHMQPHRQAAKQNRQPHRQTEKQLRKPHRHIKKQWRKCL